MSEVIFEIYTYETCVERENNKKENEQRYGDGDDVEKKEGRSDNWEISSCVRKQSERRVSHSICFYFPAVHSYLQCVCVEPEEKLHNNNKQCSGGEGRSNCIRRWAALVDCVCVSWCWCDPFADFAAAIEI